MTQDEIIEMAREAGLPGYPDELEAFAKLVAAKEREACAKVVEDSLWFTRLVVAKAIRARGQA